VTLGPVPVSGGRRSRALGWLAMAALVGAWVAIVLCTVVIATLAYRQHSPIIALLGLVAVNVLATVIQPPLSQLSAWGRRHRARDTGAGTGPADDPIVLYLRSFAVDDVTDRTGTTGWSIFRTDEEQVQRAFAPIGRMVATGKPGDRLPPAGASRIYMRHEDWQQQVRELIGRAELVLLAAGTGAGVLWEIDLLVAMFPAQRLVLLLPFDEDGYRRFHRAAASRFPQSLPERFAGVPGSPRSVKGAIYFDADWTPHLVPFDGDARDGLDLECLRTLGPVFRHCGHTQAEARFIRGRDLSVLNRWLFLAVVALTAMTALGVALISQSR
jgi:hypothetical protein